ncbi:MAG: phage major capsid protein [Sinobacteraceae bacterium]|nr:phage major capsid protein [Nevskiaceae bacterium]
MLDSVKIQRRQSEIRQILADLVGKETPSEDETRSMEAMDREYRTNETRFRAALTAEDQERREAGDELETRSDREFSDMMAGFELRQVALYLDEGAALSGQTAEIVQELRSQGGYRGIPIPYAALETRANETIAGDNSSPMQTRPIIDRLFPGSVAARMGAQSISIPHGSVEWPVTTHGATVGWQANETGNVGAHTPFKTADKALSPDNTLGVQMRITRKALKQSGAALEAAVRRDMSSAIGVEMDRVVFLGTGNAGQPLGVIAGQSTYGITATAVDEEASWGAFREAVTRFMIANAAGSPDAVRVMIRPEVWNVMDAQVAWDGTAVTQWDRLVKNIPASNIAMTTNGLAAPTGSTTYPTKALLTTNAGGVSPIFLGLWGAVDLIRDPFSDAQSGGLRITALATMDVTVARPAQLEILTGVQTVVGS